MNDNNLQQQLLQTEVTPPQQMWEKIAVVLDEIEADAPLQQKILAAEISAPESAWEEIEQRLTDRFYTEQLEDAEAEVPIKVWVAVEEQLNEKQTAKIIPFNRRYAPVYRIAAAAMITGVLAWGAYRLLKNDEPAASSVAVEAPALPIQKPGTAIADVQTVPQKETTTVATVSRTGIRKRIKEELKLNDAVVYADAVSYNNIHHKNQKSVSEKSSFSESEYLVVLNENGELVRVSKKIINMKCANNTGTLPVDAAAALQTKDCNEQIKRWQQQMAMSATLSASAGYIDLNEIINTTDQQ